MKKAAFILIIWMLPLVGHGLQQAHIEGRVISSEDNKPLAGATLKVGNRNYVTDKEGRYKIAQDLDHAYVEISYIGFRKRNISFEELKVDPLIALELETGLLEEIIVSTGYYTIPKDRSTGSFTVVDNGLLNRSIGQDFLSRLEGVTNSLHFDKRFVRPEGLATKPDLRVRGLGTINSDNTPLIVLNNFPYEGDLDLINPDDIESITISKDAAAASIWGARAGNGVIVITTKKGKGLTEKPKITVNTSYTLGEKPDLFYNPMFLSSKETIMVERELFKKGFYVENESDPLSPVIELLISERDKLINEQELENRLEKLQQNDIRQDALKYLYRNSALKQYSFGISGGFEFINYYFSVGYDESNENIIRNDNNRLTLNSNNTFKLSNRIELNTNLSFSQRIQKNNGSGAYSSAANRSFYYPYAQLKHENVNLPIVSQYRIPYVNEAEENGLLNWDFIPLNEVELNDNKKISRLFNLSTNFSFKIMNDLKLNLLYNYQHLGGNDERVYNKNSYYVRDLVNRYTQADGSKPFPEGGIFWRETNEQIEHTGRAQLNYNTAFAGKHAINGLLGAEIRQSAFNSGPPIQLNGYNPDNLTVNTVLDYEKRYPTNPKGYLLALPAPPDNMEDLTDRYISYYANAAYTFDQRLILSGSVRWDASNLFGVKINQKGVPLWSIGSSWHIGKEAFYSSTILPILSLRATYGLNGNINKSATAYPVVTYSYDPTEGLNTAPLLGPGNPHLRWEKTKIVNFGIDFGFKDNRLTGSIDLYKKFNLDLLGNDIVDPTLGISTYGGTNLIYLINYANLESKGIDIDLTTRNLIGEVGWNTNVIFNYAENRITNYNSNESPSILPYFQNRIAPPTKGMSRDVLYSLPWYGLDPNNGLPLVKIDDELNQDYSAYMNMIAQEDLINNGTSVPPFFGSIRNSFEYKNFQLSFNILWKFGYSFRRGSILYASLFKDLYGHKDFSNRWKEPGDEKFTNVPAFIPEVNSFQDEYYRYSSSLIEKGDHIRLQDIQMSYSFKNKLSRLPINDIILQFYARNLGILWRANKQGLDPDFPEANYPMPKTFGINLKVNF